MSRPIWDYPGPHRGDKKYFRTNTALETVRPDYNCWAAQVFYIPAGTPIDPRIGLPVLFRSKYWESYDVVTSCAITEDWTYSRLSASCTQDYEVFRFEDWKVDDVLIVNFGQYQYFQILPDGGFVRWTRWPPAGGGLRLDETTWIAWRIEYPDGRIVDLAPEEWFNQPYNSAYQAITAARGKPATRTLESDGSVVLRDGSGRRTMRISNGKVFPIVVDAGNPTGPHEMPVPPNSRWTDHPFFQEEAAKKGTYEWFYDDSYLRSVQAASLPRAEILKLPASEVFNIYYNLGKWEEVTSGRSVYPVFKSAIFEDVGIFRPITAAYEAMLRRRIYDTRPDLHFIDLDGKKQVGLLPWFLFPPIDGIPCYRKAKNDLLTKFFSYASIALMAAFPAGLVSLAMTAGMTYAQFKDQQKMLTDFLKAQEVAAKAQEAAAKVIEESKAPSELEARAAGLPVGGGTSGGSSAFPLLLVAAAAAAFLA